MHVYMYVYTCTQTRTHIYTYYEVASVGGAEGGPPVWNIAGGGGKL